MDFNMTTTEEQRFDNLPKWAKDMFGRMTNVLKHKNEVINDLSDNEHSGRVSITQYGSSNIPLPDDAQVEFRLMDTVHKYSDGEYKNRARFSVQIREDIRTGGECLEIHSEEPLLIESHASNVVYLLPRPIIEKNFDRFEQPKTYLR